MAGTISLSLQQQFSASTGRLLSGGRVHFFASGTTTPQNAYREAGLSNAYPNPITLDSDGRVPFLWFADGTIRVRLTDSGGVTQFDTDNIAIVGSSGGGGVDTTDANAIASTGDVKWRMQSAALSGWVRLNGRTIGSASSGASERANADTENLFTYLWTNFSDTLCPVSSGRGASAAADFAANKTITPPDMRGRCPFGLDDMGNSAASVITVNTFVSPTTAGASGGAERHTLITAELAAHTHAANVTDPGHVHSLSTSVKGVVVGGVEWPGGVGFSRSDIPDTDSNTTGITVSNDNTGGGAAHNNMPPGRLGAWYMRL